MTTNRAVKPKEVTGDPLENFELKVIPIPKASPGHVVVRVLLRPVHLADMHPSRRGYWKDLNVDDLVVGSEGVGKIHELGQGVTTVKVGQRVVPLIWSRYYSRGYGLWRDYVEVPETDLLHVPNNIPDIIAAQCFVNPWTAYGLLHQLEIPQGEYLVQTAAGSVLGRIIIGLARHKGIKSINVVRRDEWIQPLKDLGADYVINSSTEDVTARVKEITGGKGAYGAVDPVSGESSRAVAASLRDGGKLLTYSGLSAPYVMIDVKDLVRKVSVSFFLVNDFSDDLPQRAETASAIFDLLARKVIDPLVGTTYKLEEFQEAMKETMKEARGGKVFLSSY